MAAPRNLRGRSAALGSEPQVWSTTLPCQAFPPFPCLASLRATWAIAESEVVISKTAASSNRGSANPTGFPFPINRTARRAAAGLRAAMNAMGTRACARRRPIAWPMRPGPMMATLRSGWCLPIFRFPPRTDVGAVREPPLPHFQRVLPQPAKTAILCLSAP